MQLATWPPRVRQLARTELDPMVRLATPVVLAEVGWMTMGLVDTMMVGRVSAEALGGVAVGGALFFTVALFAMGLLMGLDYEVSHAFGAGRATEAHRWLVQGLYLAVLAAVPGIAVLWWGVAGLGGLGIRPAVLAHAVPFGRALSWSLLPLLLLTAMRRYLQGLGLVKPITFVVVTANLVNVVANWVLVFGHLGAPALGAEGSGWATCCSRVYMALVLAGYVVWHDRRAAARLPRRRYTPDLAAIRRLLGLGLPAGTQMALECGVFAAATALAGRLEPAALAAHQVALNVASMTFMVPLGISTAGAVRVGQAMGRRDTAAAGQAGWTALLLAASFMSCAALAFVTFPAAIVRVFTPDAAVVAVGVVLLFVAAVFQLFDGLQVVATGVLRGTGDTRTPLLANLVGHWAVGLPVGYTLCFVGGWGVIGLWVGLCVGLVAVALTLVWAWAARAGAPAAHGVTTARPAQHQPPLEI
jgi:MATE family multidrug resistance protein